MKYSVLIALIGMTQASLWEDQVEFDLQEFKMKCMVIANKKCASKGWEFAECRKEVLSKCRKIAKAKMAAKEDEELEELE
jgi:hypothetical protein